MNKKQISITALGIAAVRAIESEKAAEARICYDPLARSFTSSSLYYLTRIFSAYGEKRAPGTQGFLACRCRYFEDYLQECLHAGAVQVVILGAGLDSRAYRGEIALKRIPTFEVDHPATQAWKVERVKKVLGKIPEHVRYVPIDFNSQTLDRLLDSGFNRKLKTIFLWEGVTHYLLAEAVEDTLGWVRVNANPGSTIIFDYVYADSLTARHKRGEIQRMQRYRRFTGEGLVFGIERGEIESFLTQRGFTDVVNADSEQLKRLYCTGSNQGRNVAEIYAIVHACNG